MIKTSQLAIQVIVETRQSSQDAHIITQMTVRDSRRRISATAPERAPRGNNNNNSSKPGHEDRARINHRAVPHKGQRRLTPLSTRLNARTEALLSYLFWWISGLVFFIIERKNKYVRFHAVQSFLYLGAAAIVLGLLKAIAGLVGNIWVIGFLLGPLFGFVFYAIGFIVVLSWLYLMIQAYRGKKTRIPFFGDLAERFSR